MMPPYTKFEFASQCWGLAHKRKGREVLEMGGETPSKLPTDNRSRCRAGAFYPPLAGNIAATRFPYGARQILPDPLQLDFKPS